MVFFLIISTDFKLQYASNYPFLFSFAHTNRVHKVLVSYKNEIDFRFFEVKYLNIVTTARSMLFLYAHYSTFLSWINDTTVPPSNFLFASIK